MAFPGTYNINYYEGDTYEFIIYPKIANGAVYSLQNYTASFTIANSVGPSPTFVASASAIIAGTEATPLQYSYITCKISPSIGRSLVAGTTYYYDVQISNGVENVYTLLKGTISVTADVTGA
jgi:hypothetical protein